MSEPTRILSCPTCKASVPWRASNPDRPFCSARCRLIDLGAWADESHRIAGQADDEDSPFSENDASSDTPR